MIEYVASEIKEAQAVLIGLGEEFDLYGKLKNNQDYLKLREQIGSTWMLSFIEKELIAAMAESMLPIYRQLETILKDKNYFVVTVCKDGLVHKAGLSERRIVTPCGGYEKLQCKEKCTTDLYDVPEYVEDYFKNMLQGHIQTEAISEPVCPICGKPLVFNNIATELYAQEGYLSQWQLYNKWLSGTLNKKLCILELGVGMDFPTVIRWPFEKVAFINQKAVLFRVHTRLFQVSEETRDKAHGICQSPLDFVKELSENCLLDTNVLN